MLKFEVNTDGKKQVMELYLFAPNPCTLSIKGYDKNRPMTVLFDRQVGEPNNKINEKTLVRLPLPYTPKVTILEIECNEANNDIELLDIQFLPLKQKELVLNSADREFIKFAFNFAINSAYKKAGVYESDNGKFVIALRPTILDASGNIETTPARISRLTGEIEISKLMFDTYTVPMRFIILMHEYCHWRFKTRNELECDFNALNVFLKLGFPKTEGLYAFTKILSDSSDIHRQRATELYDFISGYPDIN